MPTTPLTARQPGTQLDSPPAGKEAKVSNRWRFRCEQGSARQCFVLSKTKKIFLVPCDVFKDVQRDDLVHIYKAALEGTMNLADRWEG